MRENVEARTYPITPRRLVVPFFWPGMVVLLGAMFLMETAENARAAPAALAAAVFLLGLFWVVVLFSQRQTITADAVEAKSLFGVKRLLRSDIQGRRRIPGNRFSPPALLVVGRDGQCVRIANADSTDGTWIDGLSDLDEAAQRAGQAELEANPALGRSLSVRIWRIRAIRYAATGLLVAAGAGLAYLLWPGTPELVAVASAVAPVAALAITFGLTRLHHESLGGRSDQVQTRWLIRPSTYLPLAGIGLGFHLGQMQLLSRWDVAMAGLLLALPVAAAAMWLDRAHLRTKSAWLPLLIVAGAAAWAAGALAEVNLAFDRAPASVHKASITEKAIEHHSRSGDSYRVTLAPWPGVHDPVNTYVSSELYAQLSEGEPMCVTQHPGALGFAWFDDRPCPPAQPSAPPNRAVHSAT